MQWHLHLDQQHTYIYNTVITMRWFISHWLDRGCVLLQYSDEGANTPTDLSYIELKAVLSWNKKMIWNEQYYYFHAQLCSIISIHVPCLPQSLNRRWSLYRKKNVNVIIEGIRGVQIITVTHTFALHSQAVPQRRSWSTRQRTACSWLMFFSRYAPLYGPPTQTARA